MSKMSLSAKLLVGGCLLVLIPVVLIGFFSFQKSSAVVDESAKSYSLLIAKSLADTIQLTFKEKLKMTEEIAVGNTTIDLAKKRVREGDKISQDDVEKMNRKLSNAIELLGEDYEAIFLVDMGGAIYSDADGTYRGSSVGDMEYFKGARSGKVSVGKVMKSKKTGNPVSPVAAPVFVESGEVVGVIGVLLRLDQFSNKVAETKLGESGYCYIADAEGIIIAHPKKELVLSLNIRTTKGMELVAGNMAAMKTGIESYVFQGKDKIAGYAPVPITGWAVGATQDQEELSAPVRSLRDGIAMIGLILLVLCIVGTVLLARSISRPIARVVEGLTEASHQMSVASGQISSASQQLAEGASEQAAAIEETSSSLEEMASMTKQNADNSKQANHLMQEAHQIVSQANRSMSGVTTAMNEISGASEETQKIIKTIDEIAFQTNLLALNAAVEAARAGEAGAGFAVVAEEVRNLAIRAADAARNTAELIAGTVKKVRDGSDLVGKTNQEFSGVSATVSKSGDLVGEIAAASDEQAQGIEQINKAVAEMDKVIQQNAANAEESASASEVMSSQAGQLNKFVSDLVLLVRGNGRPEIKSGKSGAKREPGHQIARHSAKTKATGLKGKNGNGYGVKGSGYAPDGPASAVIPFDDESMRDF